MTSVYARRLFDGDGWLDHQVVVGRDGVITSVGPGSPSQAEHASVVVIPGLIDSGVQAEGYLEGPAEAGVEPFAPEAALVCGLRSQGVTSLVDIGAGVASASWLLNHADLNVASSLARLARTPAGRADLSVDGARLDAQLAALHTLGATLVTVADDVHDDVAGWGPVVRRRSVDGTVVPGFTVCTDGASYDAPQVRASQAWDVEGMLRTVDSTRGRAFLPYLKHFQGQGNFMTRRIARDVLNRMYAHRTASDSADHALAALRRADPRRLIASSGVGNPGIPPGTGLWDEMAAVAEVHGDDQALAAATSTAGRAFPQLRAGRVAPGHRCDLVLLGSDGDLAELRRSIEGIVVAGTHSPIAAERHQLDVCNEQADRRSL